MKANTKYLLRIFLFAGFLIFGIGSEAQDLYIKGRVMIRDKPKGVLKAPAPDQNPRVLAVEDRRAQGTDSKGNFVIQVFRPGLRHIRAYLDGYKQEKNTAKVTAWTTKPNDVDPDPIELL